ncbi:unnamed protein product [Mytilus coruscus]|uniref:Reverse transcriptase RNase H-like domain-containing protein n=1 Tax=Mytilus coruscus TaxID=42192 RepID=A0A6J8CSY0_MYTCO|nr:unnamed protein product [Mytilus coruscus]
MAADHTLIPGYSEVILEAYVEKTDLDSWFALQEFLIEPSPDFMEKSCLIISTCLVDLASHVTGTIRFMNPFMNENEDDIGLTHLIEHSIDTGTAKPIKQPPRRVPLAFADKEREIVQQMERQAPIVASPADQCGYILDTDACYTGIGAVLSQVQEGQEKVIAYGSRTLNKAERNYCVTDKELLALRYFIEYYRQYLLGRKFSVRVDHQPLVWLFSLKEPKGRIARWIEILSAYDFSNIHRPGKKHGWFIPLPPRTEFMP